MNLTASQIIHRAPSKRIKIVSRFSRSQRHRWECRLVYKFTQQIQQYNRSVSRPLFEDSLCTYPRND
jgi:hypothetical protein